MAVVERGYLPIQLSGEGVDITWGHAGGADGLAYGESDGRGVVSFCVHGKQLMRADKRHRHDRHLGANGHKCWAIEERLRITGAGAAAFRKNEERHTLTQGFDAAGKAGDRGARIPDIDRNLAGAVEVPADEGDAPQIVASDNTELKRQPGKDSWGVHVGEVVGGVDGDTCFAKVLSADKCERRARKAEGEPRPELGDTVLTAAIFVKAGDQQGGRTTERGA